MMEKFMRSSVLMMMLFFTACTHKTVNNSKSEVTPEMIQIRNEKLLKIVSVTPELESNEKTVLKWKENKLGWPIAIAQGAKGEVTVFIDSGSGLTAVRENSDFSKQFVDISMVEIPGSGVLGILPTLTISNMTFKNIGVHAFDKAADSTKELGFPCCDILLGQNMLKSVDVIFDKRNKTITLLKPATDLQATKGFKVWHNPKLGNNWFTTANINGQLCENARVDTGAAYDIKIFKPWFKSEEINQVSLWIEKNKFLATPRYQITPETAVNEKVCANIGGGILFSKPFYLSYKNNFAYWLK